MAEATMSAPLSAKGDTSFEVWLDVIRWVSAFAVVCTHVNNRFLIKYLLLDADRRHFVHLIIAFIAGFGHQAVVAFFVISGLLVGGSLWNENQRSPRLDLGAYFVKRLVRLWTVLIPALFLIAVADAIGQDVFHGGPVYGIVDAEDSGAGLGVTALLCNAAFLQDAFCLQYGSDGALWSLFNEFWYYVIWPFLLIGVFSKRRPLIRGASLGVAAALLIGLACFQRLGAPIAPYFLIWLLGVVVATRRSPLVKMGRNQSALLLAVFMIAFRLAVPTAWMDKTPYAWFVADLALSLLLANTLLSAKLDPTLPTPPLPQTHRRLANFSFSLYCVHTPILNLYISILVFYFGVGWKMVPSNWQTVLLVASGVVVGVAGGYLFSLATEAHTHKLRKKALAILNGRARKVFAPKSA
jgi:peptidoglycan/LPS O-acetylase OafA/YrhL